MSRIAAPPRQTTALTQQWQANIDDHVIALAWSPNRRLIAAAAIGGPITLLDGLSGAVVRMLAGHHFGTTAVAWSADGQHFASAGQDGKIRLWDVASGQEHAAFDGGSAWVERIAWSPAAQADQPAAARVLRGRKAFLRAVEPMPAAVLVTPLLASSAGRTLRLWDAEGQLLREYPTHPSTIADIEWQPSERVLTSAAYGGVTLWSPDGDKPIADFQWKGSVLVIAWSPDGKYIATGDQDSTVHFWIVKTGEDLQMWGYPTKVRELAWDASSRYLATGGGAVVTVWDCSGKGPANSRPLQFEAHDVALSALAFQRRGPLLASASADGLIALWQPGKGKRALAQSQLGEGIAQLAWAPDDRALAVGGESGMVAAFAAPPVRG